MNRIYTKLLTLSFLNCQTPQEAQARFKVKDTKKWKIANVLNHQYSSQNIALLSYRPFDVRYVYYNDDFIERSRKEVMQNYIDLDNVGLLVTKANRDCSFNHVFITKNISEVIYLSGITATNAMNVPLYLAAENGGRKPNLNESIMKKLRVIVEDTTPEDLFDYVYAILHCPRYRKKYNEFLKLNYPRVTYPKDRKCYKELVRFGSQLRELHLLRDINGADFITTFPITGTGKVSITPVYRDRNVYINETQFFGRVPEAVWNFYVGGYQPAQKWLKDRRGRELRDDDINHYQKIIVSINETIKVMEKIDQIVDL